MAGRAPAASTMRRARCIASSMRSAAMSRHADSYSLGAGRVLMPHIVASMDELMAAASFMGGAGAAYAPVRGVRRRAGEEHAGRKRRRVVASRESAMLRMAKAGCRFVHISASRDQLDAPAGSVEWIPIRPNTDTAVMLALAHELIVTNRHDEAFLKTYCVGFERWRDYLTGAADGIAKSIEWASPIAQVPVERLRALACRTCCDAQLRQRRMVIAALGSRRAAVLGRGRARLAARTDRSAGRRLRRRIRHCQHDRQHL